MVNYEPRDLDRIFTALGDPTRRAILARLEQADSLSISALAEPFSITLPAVMKHLDVLGDAGLCARYETALRIAGIGTTRAPEDATTRGQWLVAQHAGLVQGCRP